ncbi:MAG TPA: hypothetical protein VN788_09015, partial [Verrucomicrobiae bacterium]|nr:hypothetical protein [Verrucomicrobiae bacterium]
EYMIGDRMLVAPLFAGEPSRKVTLPAGKWHDFWTGAEVQGRTFSVPASTDKIPVYVKAGSVLPLAGVSASTADSGARELTVMIFGDGSLPFSMATPSGETLELRWDPSKSAGNVRQAATDKPYNIVSWKRTS